MQSPIILQARNLTKRYGTNVIFQDISLDVHKGETIVIIGPSGTGKSTLLRCLNLLTHVDAGQIFLEGQEITAPGTNEDHVRQQTGMVFQNFLLFNHLSALENVMLGLTKVKKLPRTEAREKAMRELARENMTMLVVTHEMGFAREVADRIVFMEKGRIMEQGAPDDLFERPQHARTREFLWKITELYGKKEKK